VSKYPVTKLNGRELPLEFSASALPKGSRYGDKRANGVTHYGVDIATDPGDPIVTPETMMIVRVEAGEGISTKLDPPLDGYGPGAVVGLGSSGVWHLLAHMDPDGWSLASGTMPAIGRTYLEGEQIGIAPSGVGAARSHVHWEVRLFQPFDSPDTRAANTVDPLQWAKTLPHGWSADAFGSGGHDNPTPADPILAAALLAKRKAGPASSSSGAWKVLALLGLAYLATRSRR
jgi:murein DD-endopeptidase MepM/ murein hydrolase activator NlpD